MTHALLNGSPALNTGNAAAVANVGGVPEFDQRGVGFTRVAGGRIDIGAFEVQSAGSIGDYNHNNVVDAADYVLWRKSLGAAGLPAFSGADGDGDMTIDQDDYGVWRTHFGQTLPPSGVGSGLGSTTASAVPVAVEGQSTVAVSSLSLSVSEPRETASSEATSSQGQADSKREILPTDFTLTSSHFAPNRTAVSPSFYAPQMLATIHSDEALVAWLASKPDIKIKFDDLDSSEPADHECVNRTKHANDLRMNALEKVFSMFGRQFG